MAAREWWTYVQRIWCFACSSNQREQFFCESLFYIIIFIEIFVFQKCSSSLKPAIPEIIWNIFFLCENLLRGFARELFADKREANRSAPGPNGAWRRRCNLFSFCNSWTKPRKAILQRKKLLRIISGTALVTVNLKIFLDKLYNFFFLSQRFCHFKQSLPATDATLLFSHKRPQSTANEKTMIVTVSVMIVF